MPELFSVGNVKPHDNGKCDVATKQDAKTTGSIMHGHKIFTRAAPLQGPTPFDVCFDGRHFKPNDTSSSSDVRDVPYFPFYLLLKVAALSGTVKQHTENCLADNRSMLDLSEDCRVGADSASSN